MSWLLGPSSVLGLLAMWQILPSTRLVDPHMVPSAFETLRRFGLLWLLPSFYTDLASTLGRLAAGIALGSLIGVAGGLLLGISQVGQRAFGLTFDVLRPVPTTALVPIAALAFGIGQEMYIVVVAFAVAMPMLLATLDGIRQIDPILVATARTLRQGPRRIFSTVLLPASLPSIMTGLRVALAIALVVEISSEMMISSEGLGQRLVHDQRLLHVADVYAGIMVVALLGFVASRLILTADRYCVGWKRSSRI